MHGNLHGGFLERNWQWLRWSHWSSCANAKEAGFCRWVKGRDAPQPGVPGFFDADVLGRLWRRLVSYWFYTKVADQYGGVRDNQQAVSQADQFLIQKNTYAIIDPAHHNKGIDKDLFPRMRRCPWGLVCSDWPICSGIFEQAIDGLSLLYGIYVERHQVNRDISQSGNVSHSENFVLPMLLLLWFAPFGRYPASEIVFFHKS